MKAGIPERIEDLGVENSLSMKFGCSKRVLASSEDGGEEPACRSSKHEIVSSASLGLTQKETMVEESVEVSARSGHEVQTPRYTFCPMLNLI